MSVGPWLEDGFRGSGIGVLAFSCWNLDLELGV